MWKRLYFVLALVRLYLTLQPSYLHPDEHFQGPEVIAGKLTSPDDTDHVSGSRAHIHRPYLFLSRDKDVGIHFFGANPQYLCTMASLRHAHAHPPMADRRFRPR